MVTKAQIFNLALQTLLLNRQIINPDSPKTNEERALSTNWDIALNSALADMNLTSTCTRANLQLITTNPLQKGNDLGPWQYAYKYPNNCAFFRRVFSGQEVDDKRSHVPKLVTIWNNEKVIFANLCQANFANAAPTLTAVGEYIPTNFPIQTLQADAAMCIAHKLALCCASLVTGKGSASLMGKIEKNYVLHKTLAQAVDANESFSFQSEATMSEFVEERLS